jgi:LAO/AO transport system ATPase
MLRRPPDDLAALWDRLLAGDRAALSRLLTLTSRGRRQEIESLLERASRKRTPVVAFTGSGGAGKSSLLGALVEHLIGQGTTVGVLACDPQSPFTGGALLGDRCRIAANLHSERLFLRSLSTALGQQAIAANVDVMLRLMGAFGFDHAFVETVGAGQGDTEVRNLADVVVLVLQPQTGDELQWEKAGVLEAADIVVVHKCDLPGADQTAADVRHHVSVPVLKTSVTRREGIDPLLSAIDNCCRQKLAAATDRD